MFAPSSVFSVDGQVCHTCDLLRHNHSQVCVRLASDQYIPRYLQWCCRFVPVTAAVDGAIDVRTEESQAFSRQHPTVPCQCIPALVVWSFHARSRIHLDRCRRVRFDVGVDSTQHSTCWLALDAEDHPGPGL